MAPAASMSNCCAIIGAGASLPPVFVAAEESLAYGAAK